MINVSQTIKNSCKADKNTHKEYIVINNQIIDIKGKLNATAYKDTTFFGTFNMKVLEFETSNDTQFRNRQFEYYKVIDGNEFKIGTFITTEVVDNDSKETIKVTANDYGLKFAVPYTTSLDYTSGNITLFQVLQECCSQVGITLRNQSITNGDFIVDSNQFVNNELVGDVVSAIAGISGNFATIDENDKLYLLFANNTGNLITKDIEETSEITNFDELNDSTLKGKTTQNGTPTPSNPIEVETRTGLQQIIASNKNLCYKAELQGTQNIRFYFRKVNQSNITISFTINESLSNNSLYLRVDDVSYGIAKFVTASANTKAIANITFNETQLNAIQNGSEMYLLLYKNGANFVVPDDVQIEVGTSATNYVEHKEIVNEINLGKNLFNKDNAYASGNNLQNITLDLTNLKVGTKYKFYANEKSWLTIRSYNSSNVLVRTLGNTNTTKVIEFVPQSNEIKFVFSFYAQNNVDISTYDFTNVYIYEYTYELCKIRDYQDKIYKNNGKWYLHKEIKKIILDGSESWTLGHNNSSTGYAYFYTNTYDNIIKQEANANNHLCNRLIPVNQIYTNYNDDGNKIATGQSTTNKIRIAINTANSVSELKTYLSNNNLICYIPLATPTETEITNTELIGQLENIRLLNGYNYIVSSLPIEIEYYDDNGEVLKDYSDLNDKRDTQPITSVSIGSSQIQGQEAILRDTELIEEYGEHWLTINDNPFAYTLEKRQRLVTAIFNKVKGFGYSSFTSKYTYRPYLSLGDKIKFKNKAGQLIDSIILRYNMDYDDCTFEAPSITSSTINYELSPSPEETAKRAEIIANQAEAKITSVVSKVDEVEVTVYGEYELTKDTTYQEDKTYYVFDGTDYIEFTDFEVGDTIPANTIYERDETSSLEQRMQQAEFTLHEQGAVLEIKTSKIDDDGNTTSFKTTNYTLDENGFEIDDGSGYKSLSTTTGQYYYDNDVMVGKYTKDIAVHKDLALYGKYYYGIDDEDSSFNVDTFTKDDAMFMAQMYEAQWEDENGTTQTEPGFGHFWNGD